MHSTSVIFAFAAFATISCASGEITPVDGYFSPEQECNARGGLCIHQDLCESSARDDAACPSQKSSGAVCCHQLPSNETRCLKHGGECRLKTECRRTFVTKATDCGEEQICCVLVH